MSSNYSKKINKWIKGWFRCPSCRVEADGFAGFSIVLDAKNGKPSLKCLNCSFLANREEFLMKKKGKGNRDKPRKEPKKEKYKAVRHLKLRDGVTVTMSGELPPCSNCYTRPNSTWDYHDYTEWEKGTCPNCMATSKKGSGSIVTYQGGLKKEYLSYNDYYEEKAGSSIGKAAAHNTGAAYTLCSHIRVPVQIARGVVVYAFSWRGSSIKDLEGLDYFVALDHVWLDEGEILVSPGTEFRFKIERNSPRFVYLSTPDFGTPANLQALVELVEWIVQKARKGTKIGVGCMGGHGRTGVLLAALTLAAGTFDTGDLAISGIRNMYCQEAVESWSQQILLQSLAKHIWPTDGIVGGLSKVSKEVNAAHAAQVSTYSSEKRAEDAKLPGVVRLTSTTYAPLKAYEGQYARVSSWSGDAYSILVMFKDHKSDMLTKSEYEIISYADEALAFSDEEKENIDAKGGKANTQN